MASVKKLLFGALALVALSGLAWTTGCSKEGGSGGATGGSTDTAGSGKKDQGAKTESPDSGGYGTRGDSETGGIDRGTMNTPARSGGNEEKR